MNRKNLIQRYKDFFIAKGHKEIPNASLLPENDPTVLFITAGMQPLVPFLSGKQDHPQGKRLVNVQRCIRTGDIESVGDTYHHTFFEMLGNWSLGDYGKKEAIEMTFEFYTKGLGIPKEKIAVTVFAGDPKHGVQKDEESREIWKGLGIPKEKIITLTDDNWWGPAGKTGPCGPSTEVFYWKPKNEPVPEKLDKKDFNEGKWVEIGNDVLMEYVKDTKGDIVSAKQKNIDFGGGVERTIATLNGLEDNYLADMWKPIIEKIEMISEHTYGEDEQVTRAMRIIADHLKAACFIINDGVNTSNTEQGYVLRRLIRRAIRFGRVLGVEKFTTKIADSVIALYDDYSWDDKKVLIALENEEEKFLKTLEQGLRMFEKMISTSLDIDGKQAFLLYQSYGFPIEMTQELRGEKGGVVDLKGYEAELAKHQELSRTATAGKFKSGLADHSEETTRLHTATHLLLAAMNCVLEPPKGMKAIEQRGSNITPQRARFDFSYSRKLTDEEVKDIEDMVNAWISEGHDVQRKEMSLLEAKKFGAQGIFEDKYSSQDRLSVYVVGDGSFSKELCTGPHVKTLKELQPYTFTISKQKSVGAGVRRVKVTLEKK